ncbi:isochorismate synthase [Bacillus luteolus]|uniref:Isochorismate synthase MenF n=1 Tax=Litchfieldia luteola TaxID=682179 RepID=A0ABR9QIX0_9BACI|nr:isochorismate synthase [Cytobacillus luteolus]
MILLTVRNRLFGGIKVVIIQESILKEHQRKKNTSLSPLLRSYTQKVENVDPLTFFTIGNKYFPGKRFFWTEPSNETILVGLGFSHTIEVNQSLNRFQNIEEEWKRLLITNQKNQKEFKIGTGPMLFGGFSFDPYKKKTKLWSNFLDAKFVMPTLMLTVHKDECYLTTNFLYNKEEEIQTREHELNPIKDELLTEYNLPSETLLGQDFKMTEVMPEEWKQSVKEVTNKIKQGQVEKVVLAREVRLFFDNSIEITNVIANLREQQPLSYTFAFENGKDCFVGASPERLVKKENQEVLSTCLAGSIKRGTTLKEDDDYGNLLLNDKKNIIEHEVVVHMIKDAMSKACNHLEVPSKPSLYKMRDIQHLYTPVKGIVKEDVSLLSIVESLHPTPALGGFPKEEAIKMIRETEVLDRGWYAGPIGWIDSRDNGEFAVAIRSALLQENEASLFAGCGIVGDSEPESEYKETEIKFKPMLSALGGI